jgi:quercetin dioxygenase-like cupin family protein
MAQQVREREGYADRVTLLTTAQETDGELFRFEYRAREITGPPPEHTHLDIEERVEVLEGRLHCTLDGKLRVLEAGETLVIPRGVAHTLWNESPEGSRSIGEFRPAGDMQRLVELAFPIARE